MISSRRRTPIVSLLVIAVGAAVLAVAPAAVATADVPVAASVETVFTTADGVELQTTLTGEAPLADKPVVVEFSPYGPGTGNLDPGPDYNFLLVEIRGTGRSQGSFDALGPRTQTDVAEVLGWACQQEWSNGHLALNGFSASAITVYNSLHLDLPCVDAAVLKSGTYELYRDLLYPGGIQNLVPTAVVLGAIGGSTAIQGLGHLDDPATLFDQLSGQLGTVVDGLRHSTQDEFWLERGFRGDVNDLPILMIGGFYDVESRGAFEAFQELRDDGAHLRVVGAHDGAPEGTDGGVAAARAWLDRWVRGIDNEVEDEPAVELLVGNGGYGQLQSGDFTRIAGADWPLPGTRWLPMALDSTRSGTSASPNDGTLTLGEPGPKARSTFLSAPSFPTATDPYTVSTVGPAGAFLLRSSLAEPLGLSWTTEPFTTDVVSVGPASLELRLRSTSPESGIWVTLSDVAPDGTSSPVAAGRLSSAFPDIDEARSRRDPVTGDIVQPYGIFDEKQPARLGQDRLYRIEIWPVGNTFQAGHRLRVGVSGASALSTPLLPGLDTVTVGRGSGSRLLFPVVGGTSADPFASP